MLLDLLKTKRDAIKQIGNDAAIRGLKLDITPSWITYARTSATTETIEAAPLLKKSLKKHSAR